MNRPPTPYRARLISPARPGDPAGPLALVEPYGRPGLWFRIDRWTDSDGREPSLGQYRQGGEADVEVLGESWQEDERSVILDLATFGTWEVTEFIAATGAWLDG